MSGTVRLLLVAHLLTINIDIDVAAVVSLGFAPRLVLLAKQIDIEDIASRPPHGDANFGVKTN